MEITEGKKLSDEVKEFIRTGELTNFKDASNLQRARLPAMCEPISVWRDVIECRNFFYDKIKTHFANSAVDHFIVDATWNQITLARQARRQNLREMCF